MVGVAVESEVASAGAELRVALGGPVDAALGDAGGDEQNRMVPAAAASHTAATVARPAGRLLMAASALGPHGAGSGSSLEAELGGAARGTGGERRGGRRWGRRDRGWPAVRARAGPEGAGRRGPGSAARGLAAFHGRSFVLPALRLALARFLALWLSVRRPAGLDPGGACAGGDDAGAAGSRAGVMPMSAASLVLRRLCQGAESRDPPITPSAAAKPRRGAPADVLQRPSPVHKPGRPSGAPLRPLTPAPL